MVRDHLHRDVVLLAGVVGLPREGRDLRDEGREQIGVVVRHLALEHRRDPLEPHAGVDRGLGQRRHRAARVAVELHEDQVPDLEPPVAVAGRPQADPARLLLGARQMIALVEVDLGAGPARAGVPHRPEVVLLAQAEDPVGGQELLPELERLVVVGEDGGLEPVLGQAEVLGQELPAELDRVLLEVVPEGEVAQHLEEGVVPGGAADVLQVIVLAAGPHALLGGGRPDVVPALLPQEHGLELHHARVGEEQGGVLGGHQRRGPHHRMPAPAEVFEEPRADLAPGHRTGIIRPASDPRNRAPELRAAVFLDAGEVGPALGQQHPHRVAHRRGRIAAAQEVVGQTGRRPGGLAAQQGGQAAPSRPRARARTPPPPRRRR